MCIEWDLFDWDTNQRHHLFDHFLEYVIVQSVFGFGNVVGGRHYEVGSNCNLLKVYICSQGQV